ncbi:MAG: cytochrome c oxidase assembly protein [Chloroflexota bacterium]
MVPSNQALLTQWNWAPSILIGLLAVVCGYFYAVGPLRRKRHLGPPATVKQVTYCVLAMVVVVIALLSPIDAIGDRYLFTVHMVQHLLLAALWPPLLLLSIPDWLVRPLFRRRIWGSPAPATTPVAALLLFNADVYAWHVPALYDATLTNEMIHIVEHLSFMAVGLVNWWPVLSPMREQRLSYPIQMLYLFAEGTFMMGLGILFTFSPFAFYSPYVSAPRLWGLSAVNDQQLGGLTMWYPGNLPYAFLLSVAFYRWFDEQDPAYEASSASSEESIPYNESPQIHGSGAGAR